MVSMFSPADLAQIEERDMTVETVQRQVEFFQSGFPHLDIQEEAEFLLELETSIPLNENVRGEFHARAYTFQCLRPEEEKLLAEDALLNSPFDQPQDHFPASLYNDILVGTNSIVDITDRPYWNETRHNRDKKLLSPIKFVSSKSLGVLEETLKAKWINVSGTFSYN